jgi:uncharacterized protein involved in exopolysaccharide biosynthesis
MVEQAPASPPPQEQADEFNLLDLLIVLAKHKRLVFGFPLAATVVAAIVSLILPSSYTATAKILPPQQSQSNAVAILGQLGAIGQLGGSSLGLKNPSDIFVAMLKSRTVSDAIIKRFDLQKRYDQDLLVDARRALEKRRDVSATRDGVITIEVEDRDPVRAADMANGFVEELERLTLTLAVSEASQRRLFFEKQLAQSKEDLAKAEVELKSFLQKSKLVTPEGQAQLTVAAAASLRAQITAREVQLAAMRAFATEQNPELARVQKEVAGLKTQLARMEKEAYGGQGDVLVSLGQAPETAVEYLQRVREVKYNETLFQLLARQFEAAKIDEAKNATLIQVLDRAIQPERRSFPKRTLIVAVTAALAFLLAVIAAYLLEYFARSKNDPVVGQQIEDFLRHLRERR